MKITDLRIGNLIMYDGKIKEADTWVFEDLSIHADWVKPIPITPEWLLRLGIPSEHPEWEYQIPVGALKWYFRYNTEWYSEIGGIYIDSRVQYVHQVHNLYYALTGNEINVKP